MFVVKLVDVSSELLLILEVVLSSKNNSRPTCGNHLLYAIIYFVLNKSKSKAIPVTGREGP
jgi:hypothetical protein